MNIEMSNNIETGGGELSEKKTFKFVRKKGSVNVSKKHSNVPTIWQMSVAVMNANRSHSR